MSKDDIDRNAESAGAQKSYASGEAGFEAQRQAEARKLRAAETLRENLLRRKQQGRARRAGAADETSGLPAVKRDELPD